MGASVIAAASSDEKLAHAQEHGADRLVNYSTEDLRERVKALTEGRGADVIYDPVGGDIFDASMRCIAWNGRLLVIGFASGRIAEAKTNIVLLKEMSVSGSPGAPSPFATPPRIEPISPSCCAGTRPAR